MTIPDNWSTVERYIAVPNEMEYLGQQRTSVCVRGIRKGEMFREEMTPNRYGIAQDEEALMSFVAKNEERKWYERNNA